MPLLRALAARRRELLLLAASCVVALVLAEGVVRLVAPQLLVEGDSCYRNDAELGWAVLPRFDETVTNAVDFSIHVRTNSLGMRGGEPAGRHPAVFGLGDSFMFGFGVEEDEAFLSVAARSLGGEALNGGVPGYDVCQAVDLGARLLPRLDADVIVLAVFLGNDELDTAQGRFRMTVRDGFFLEPGQEWKLTSWRRRLFHPLFTHSHLVRLLRWSPLAETVESHLLGRPSLRRRAQRALLSTFEVPPSDEIEEGDRQIRACLPRLRRLADQAGLPLLAMLIPDRLEVHPERLDAELAAVGLEPGGYDLAAPERRFEQMLDEAGIAVFDLLPLLRADAAAGRRLYFRVDRHLDAEGSERVGELLAARLGQLLDPSRSSAG